jgi:hypothetical protein
LAEAITYRKRAVNGKVVFAMVGFDEQRQTQPTKSDDRSEVTAEEEHRQNWE